MRAIYGKCIIIFIHIINNFHFITVPLQYYISEHVFGGCGCGHTRPCMCLLLLTTCLKSTSVSDLIFPSRSLMMVTFGSHLRYLHSKAGLPTLSVCELVCANVTEHFWNKQHKSSAATVGTFKWVITYFCFKTFQHVAYQLHNLIYLRTFFYSTHDLQF